MVLIIFFFFFFNDTATTEIYTLSLPTLFRSRGLAQQADFVLRERTRPDPAERRPVQPRPAQPRTSGVFMHLPAREPCQPASAGRAGRSRRRRGRESRRR